MGGGAARRSDTEVSGMSEWGRVAEDGTVYVTTPDGERAVGSWQAGPPEEGLALFARKYEQLSTEVALLEQRLRAGVGDPNQVRQSAQRLKSTVPPAQAVGDLAALEARVDGLLARTEEAAEQAKAKKAEARAAAAVRKDELATEAEGLAGSSDWKTAGERLRTIGDDWKRLPHLEKKADDELWARVAASRSASPSGAPRTSRRSRSSGPSRRRARRSWSPRRRSCRAAPTGRPQPTATSSS